MTRERKTARYKTRDVNSSNHPNHKSLGYTQNRRYQEASRYESDNSKTRNEVRDDLEEVRDRFVLICHLKSDADCGQNGFSFFCHLIC